MKSKLLYTPIRTRRLDPCAAWESANQMPKLIGETTREINAGRLARYAVLTRVDDAQLVILIPFAREIYGRGASWWVAVRYLASEMIAWRAIQETVKSAPEGWTEV